MPTDPSELSALLQQRDMNAAARYLVEHHADEVLSLCRAMVRDESAAEDLSQDVFGRAFAALANFRGDASSRTWILRIARNRCIDHLRALQRELRDEELSPEDAPALEPRVDDLLAARGQVRIGLGVLGENERALVMLRFGHGLGYAELADTFGLSEGSTRMRVSRAVAKMRLALEPEVAAPPQLGSAGGARKRSAAPAPQAAAPPSPRAVSPAGPPSLAAPPSPPASRGAAPSPFASVASHALRTRLNALAAAC